MKNDIAIKTMALSGIFAVVFYFLHVVFGNIFYNNYNPLAQAVSDLTASNSPSGNIVRVFAFIYGIFSVLFTIGFFVYFKSKINRLVSLASCVFCIMNIVSFFGYTFFPLSESGYAGTFQDKMHMAVTICVVLLTIISLIIYGIGFIRTINFKYIGIISLGTLLLLMTGSMLINILPKEYFGLAERINVYSIVIYTGILSLWMYKYIKNSG